MKHLIAFSSLEEILHMLLRFYICFCIVMTHTLYTHHIWQKIILSCEIIFHYKQNSLQHWNSKSFFFKSSALLINWTISGHICSCLTNNIVSFPLFHPRNVLEKNHILVSRNANLISFLRSISMGEFQNLVYLYVKKKIFFCTLILF